MILRTFLSSGDTGPERGDHSSEKGYNHCNTLLMKVKRGVEEGLDVNENAHRTATGTTYATYRNIIDIWSICPTHL